MKVFTILLTVLAAVLVISCNKYAKVDPGAAVAGYAYIVDPYNVQPPAPVASMPLYLNNGTDTTSYILQSSTDGAGHFLVAYLATPRIIFCLLILLRTAQHTPAN